MNDSVLRTTIDESGLIHSSLHGSIPAERIPQLESDIRTGHVLLESEFAKRGKKLRVLVDLTDFSGAYDTKGIIVLAKYVRSNKPFVEKSAGFGAGRAVSLAANVVTALGGRSDISFFKTGEEALAWLVADS